MARGSNVSSHGVSAETLKIFNACINLEARVHRCIPDNPWASIWIILRIHMYVYTIIYIYMGYIIIHIYIYIWDISSIIYIYMGYIYIYIYIVLNCNGYKPPTNCNAHLSNLAAPVDHRRNWLHKLENWRLTDRIWISVKILRIWIIYGICSNIYPENHPNVGTLWLWRT